MKDISGVYVGKLESLKDERATLMERKDGKLLAQFTNKNLYLDSKALWYGWHLFEKTEFLLDEK